MVIYLLLITGIRPKIQYLKYIQFTKNTKNFLLPTIRVYNLCNTFISNLIHMSHMTEKKLVNIGSRMKEGILGSQIKPVYLAFSMCRFPRRCLYSMLSISYRLSLMCDKI